MKVVTKEKIEEITIENNTGFVQPILQPVRTIEDHWLFYERYIFEDEFGIHDIPKGFICDLDSIPRIPFIYSFFKGRARASAAIHDWYYATGLISREQADLIFYSHMIKEGVSPRTAKLMYLSVKWFGWMHYDKKVGVKETFLN